MTIKGGDIKGLYLGTLKLHPVEEGSFEFALGGSELTGHKSGDGTFYATGKNSLAFIRGPVLGDNADKVLEALQAAADSGTPQTVTMIWFDSTTYAGQMLPMGQHTYKSDGSIDLDLQGEKLEQI